MEIIALLAIAFVVCLIIRWFPAVDKPWYGSHKPRATIDLSEMKIGGQNERPIGRRPNPIPAPLPRPKRM